MNFRMKILNQLIDNVLLGVSSKVKFVNLRDGKKNT